MLDIQMLVENYWKVYKMDSSKVVELTDKVVEFLETANDDEMTGKIFNLSKQIQENDSPKDMLELALIVFLGSQDG